MSEEIISGKLVKMNFVDDVYNRVRIINSKDSRRIKKPNRLELFMEKFSWGYYKVKVSSSKGDDNLKIMTLYSSLWLYDSSYSPERHKLYAEEFYDYYSELFNKGNYRVLLSPSGDFLIEETKETQ